MLIPAFMQNHFFTKEKMLQDFDFPIAMSFGTRDYFGSAEGADRIVKNNKHFKSGRSQIFLQRNTGHNLMWEDPDKLIEHMVGFFEGSILGTWELKPRKQFIPDDPKLKTN